MIDATTASRSSTMLKTFRDFWFAPATPRPLAWFRIGLAAVLLIQAISVVGHLNALYGSDGIVNGSVMDPVPGLPNLGWLERVVTGAGLPSSAVVPLACAAYVTGLAGLLLGFCTRWSALLAWLTHTALMTTGEMSMYGVDQFAQIGLFYCVWFPVGRTVSLDALKKPGFFEKPGFCSARPSFESRLALRVLQFHVIIAYTASGVAKMMGEQWWSGEAVWRAVMGADDALLDCSFLAAVPWLAQGVCWLTLLLEAGCPLFVWHPLTRRFWLAGVVAMHAGIALTLDLWVFAATMIVFDVTVFGLSAHPIVQASDRDRTHHTSPSALAIGEPECPKTRTRRRGAVLTEASR